MQNFNLDSCMPFPFVGLFGCPTMPASVSGVNVNDLEGINTNRLTQITEAEAPRLIDKFKQLDRVAKAEFFNDVIADIAVNEIEFNSSKGVLHYTGELGDMSSCLTVQEVGYHIEKVCADPLSILNVSDIEFVPCAEFALTIEIRENGMVKKTIVHNTRANCTNRVQIHYSTFSNNFDIVLLLCGQEMLDGVCDSCITYSNNQLCYLYECACFSATPTRKLTASSITENVTANGIRISGACICDPTALVCKYAHQLAVAYKYKLGIAILEDAINSDAVTLFTTANRKANIELIKSWRGFQDVVSGRWVTGKYTQALRNVTKHISRMAKQMDTECVVCTGLVYQHEVY